MQQVLERLERWILAAALSVGSRLPPERVLARELHTSRATLREALRLLRSLGIVESSPRRGTRIVAPPTLPLRTALPDLSRFGNPEEVMEARMLVEPAVAALAALRSTPGDWEVLARTIAGGRAATSPASFERWDRLFHTHLARCAGNRPLAYLVELLQGVRDAVLWGRLKREDLAQPGRMADYLADHEAILEAVRHRHPEEARRRMSEHLARVHRNLLEQLPLRLRAPLSNPRPV